MFHTAVLAAAGRGGAGSAVARAAADARHQAAVAAAVDRAGVGRGGHVGVLVLGLGEGAHTLHRRAVAGHEVLEVFGQVARVLLHGLLADADPAVAARRLLQALDQALARGDGAFLAVGRVLPVVVVVAISRLRAASIRARFLVELLQMSSKVELSAFGLFLRKGDKGKNSAMSKH